MSHKTKNIASRWGPQSASVHVLPSSILSFSNQSQMAPRCRVNRLTVSHLLPRLNDVFFLKLKTTVRQFWSIKKGLNAGQSLAMNHATGNGSFLLVVSRHDFFARTFQNQKQNWEWKVFPWRRRLLTFTSAPHDLLTSEGTYFITVKNTNCNHCTFREFFH